MFKSARDARLYLVSFFFVHTTMPFVFPMLLAASPANVWWLALLMLFYVPACGGAIMGIRYLPRQRGWLFSREKTVYLKAVEESGVTGRHWTLAYYCSTVAILATLVFILLRVRDLEGL